jgi:hypothetical protein
MGVHGLASFLAEHRDRAGQRVDLVAQAAAARAAGAPPPTVLVDGASLSLFLQARMAATAGGVGMALGGHEYATLDAVVRRFAEGAARAGVRLHCLLDGGRGTHWGQWLRKRATVAHRRREQAAQLDALLRSCTKRTADSDADQDAGVSPHRRVPPAALLGSNQFCQSLARAGVTYAYVLGEADDALVAAARADPHVVAVLSTDTDLCLTPHVRLLLLRDDGGDGGSGSLELAWDAVTVYTPAKVAAALGVREAQLADLAALCGNDITASWIERTDLLTRLAIPTFRPAGRGPPRATVADVAAWLRALPMPLSAHPAVAAAAAASREHAGLLAALAENARFYSAEGASGDADDAVRRDGLGQPEPARLRQLMEAGRVPGSAVAIARNGLVVPALLLGVPSADSNSTATVSGDNLLRRAHLPLYHVRTHPALLVSLSCCCVFFLSVARTHMHVCVLVGNACMACIYVFVDVTYVLCACMSARVLLLVCVRVFVLTCVWRWY